MTGQRPDVMRMIRGLREIIFDKTPGRAWAHQRNRREPEAAISLANVAGLQICQYVGDGDESSFPVYELNLILTDPPGDRFHVVGHGSESKLLADANTLAEFLGVPILDG